MRLFYYLFVDFDYVLMLRVHAEEQPIVGKTYPAEQFNTSTRTWEPYTNHPHKEGQWECRACFDLIGEGLPADTIRRAS